MMKTKTDPELLNAIKEYAKTHTCKETAQQFGKTEMCTRSLGYSYNFTFVKAVECIKVPDDFAEVCSKLTKKQCAKHYNVRYQTIVYWEKHTGCKCIKSRYKLVCEDKLTRDMYIILLCKLFKQNAVAELMSVSESEVSHVINNRDNTYKSLTLIKEGQDGSKEQLRLL